MVWTNSNFSRGWNPWRELGRVQSELRGLFEGPLNPRGLAEFATGGSQPRINVATDDDGATLTVLVPGYASEDLDIAVDGETVTITARRQRPEPLEDQKDARRELPYGECRRSLRLPFEADADKAVAKLERGVLELRLPKSPELRPKTIPVNAG